MKKYKIEEYQNQDKIYEVLCEFNKYFVPKVKETEEELKVYAEKLAKLSYFVVAKDDDNNVVSFIDYYANDHKTKMAFITLLVLKPEYQELGAIGQISIGQLLTYMRDQLRMQGFHQIRAEVYKSNTHAIKLYERIGGRYEKDVSEGTIYMLFDI